MTAVPVVDAARELGERPGTLRRWIREGCPTARRGARGRGHAVLVDPDQVRRWRDTVAQGDRARLLAELAAIVPELVADAALHALGEASPHAQGGAELRRLRIAIAATARLASDAVLRHLAEKSNAGD